MKNKFLLTIKNICSAVMLVLAFTWQAHAHQSLNKIVAIVNNDIISYSELNKTIKLIVSQFNDDQNLPERSILEQQVLNKMIIDKLQLQLAAKLGIEVDSLRLNEIINDAIKKSGLTANEYRINIEKKLGIPFEEYRELIKQEFILSNLQRRVIADELRISNADIEGYLNSPIGQDVSGIQYKLGHILLLIPESPTPKAVQSVRDKAENIVRNLKNGTDFAKTAMQYSQNQNALQGGNLGLRPLGAIPSLFVKYVTAMQVGEIIGPIRGAGGFHIIKLIEKRIGNEPLDTEMHVRQILIKSDQNLIDQDIQNKLLMWRQQILENKISFEKLAQQHSIELNTATKGGDLGWINEKSVLPEFYKAINKLSENEISQPFKTGLGWHLVQMLGKRSKNTSLEAARNKAIDILRERKFNEMLDVWLRQLKEDAQIEVFL